MTITAADRKLTLALAAAARRLSSLLASAPARRTQNLLPLKVGTLKQSSLTDIWVAKQAGIFAAATASTSS